jgi:hypothetical protein
MNVICLATLCWTLWLGPRFSMTVVNLDLCAVYLDITGIAGFPQMSASQKFDVLIVSVM